MIVVIRIDLDAYDLDTLAKLFVNGVLTMGEISESRAYQAMSELDRLRWVRKHQREREFLKSA